MWLCHGWTLIQFGVTEHKLRLLHFNTNKLLMQLFRQTDRCIWYQRNYHHQTKHEVTVVHMHTVQLDRKSV